MAGCTERVPTLRDVELSGRRALVRVDYNVPIENGIVKNDRRIKASLPTVRHIVESGGMAILISHLGRPESGPDPRFSLRPVSGRLTELLGRDVGFVEDCLGERVRDAVSRMRAGDVILLENTRFHPGETRNDDAFARELASLADIYVNDAFGSAHRAHASTHAVANHLPGCIGYLMEREVDALTRVLDTPPADLTVVLGGAKVSDKIGVVSRMVEHGVSSLIVGGGMAFTFIAANNGRVGTSLLERDMLQEARMTLQRCEKVGVDLLLPVDVVAVRSLEGDPERITCEAVAIPDGWAGVDIGERSIEMFTSRLTRAETIFWNGPMGVFETPPFAKGTAAIARAMVGSRGFRVAGGGDTLRAIDDLGIAEGFSHLSTGGGASMEFLEGRELPGLAILKRKVCLR